MNFREQLTGMNNHYRYYDLECFFKKLQEHDIHYAELWTGPMHFYVDAYGYEDLTKLRKLQDRYDVKIIGICPEQTNPKPNHIASPTRQDDIYRYYQNMIHIAKEIGCNQVLVTSGWSFYNENKQEAWNRSVKMMKRICEYAQINDVTLVMEALQYDESLLVNDVKDLKAYRAEVGYDCLKVCIDFGAMARVNDTLDDYFQAFGSDVVHIHFVDGAPCGHLAWGDGRRNLVSDLKQLETYGYRGYLSLETATSRYFQEPWVAEETTLLSFKRWEGGKV